MLLHLWRIKEAGFPPSSLGNIQFCFGCLRTVRHPTLRLLHRWISLFPFCGFAFAVALASLLKSLEAVFTKLDFSSACIDILLTMQASGQFWYISGLIGLRTWWLIGNESWFLECGWLGFRYSWRVGLSCKLLYKYSRPHSVSGPVNKWALTESIVMVPVHRLAGGAVLRVSWVCAAMNKCAPVCERHSSDPLLAACGHCFCYSWPRQYFFTPRDRELRSGSNRDLIGSHFIKTLSTCLISELKQIFFWSSATFFFSLLF